jgi:hypothetical protein
MRILVLALSAAAALQVVRPIGAVLEVDRQARRITIKTDAGSELRISYDDTTRFLRVTPGAKDLDGAAAVSVSDLAAGDRILARGKAGADGAAFLAASIVVMSKTDLAKKHAAERAEWEKRGIAGVITGVNAASAEITVTVPAAGGAKPIVVALAPGAVLRRYAPNSVKFSDARPSKFEELRSGDQIRALGTRQDDRFAAEELVSGTFRTVAATVVSSAADTVVLADAATKKQLHARITQDSIARRLTAPMVEVLGTPGRRPPDWQSTVEKLPPLGAPDLKPGEAVIVSFAASENTSIVTAITLFAGVEPLLRPSRGGKPLDLGSWNLDLNMNVGVP